MSNIIQLIKSYIGILYYLFFPVIFGRGYESFKNYFIKKKLKKKKITLSKYIDERIVEIPWVIKELKKIKGNMLDAGSTLNKYYIIKEIKHFKKIFFTTLFPEKKYFNNLNISYTYEDLCDLSFKDNYFDVVTCISTLEHIGFDNKIYNYGNFKHSRKKIGKETKLHQALKNMKRVLKRNGTMLISVPFGKFFFFNNMRQFDSSGIKKLIKILKPKKYTMKFFKYYNNNWHETLEKNCSSILPISKRENKINTAISANSVVLIKIIK